MTEVELCDVYEENDLCENTVKNTENTENAIVETQRESKFGSNLNGLKFGSM